MSIRRFLGCFALALALLGLSSCGGAVLDTQLQPAHTAPLSAVA